MELEQIKTNITNLKKYWYQRNQKFKTWYQILIMIDEYARKNKESYVSNETMTF